jgi:hypothetical protein
MKRLANAIKVASMLIATLTVAATIAGAFVFGAFLLLKSFGVRQDIAFFTSMGSCVFATFIAIAYYIEEDLK